MKIKTKYNIGDRVKYIDEDFIDNGICECCKSSLQEMTTIENEGTIYNIQIRVEKDSIVIDYAVNGDLIDETHIIKKIKNKKIKDNE